MQKHYFEDIEAKRLTIEENAVLPRFPYACLLANIRSLYNVGSIFRSADSFRCGKLFLSGYTEKPPRKEIAKTALGATELVPWEYHPSVEESIVAAKNQGYSIIAVEHTTNSNDYRLFQPQKPVCFVMGNELTGLQNDDLALCDGAIEIPMYGVKHSLNVAVCTGIVMAHFTNFYANNK
jgi:tRNA G18 (ribose-2'-O)-methylase SpoU